MNKPKENARYRLLYIYQILMEDTDEDHPTTITRLAQQLQERYGMTASRDSMRDDLEVLCKSGLPVERYLSTQYRYYYDGNVFETAELKLLLDAVAASRFITEKKSERMTKLLLKTASVSKAKALRRHVAVEGRVKSGNERGYYIVDAVNEAIDAGRKVTFQYTDYDEHKNLVLRHDGRRYTFSPYALIWDGDYYYTVGWTDPEYAVKSDLVSSSGESAIASSESDLRGGDELLYAGGLRTFRLDRIAQQPEILEEPAVPAPENFDIAAYRKAIFRMFSTADPVEVNLLCENRIMRAIIDQFGLDVPTEPVDRDHFRTVVSVCPSPTFYRWVFGWGWDGAMTIEGPKDIVQHYRTMLRKALKEQPSLYGINTDGE